MSSPSHEVGPENVLASLESLAIRLRRRWRLVRAWSMAWTTLGLVAAGVAAAAVTRWLPGVDPFPGGAVDVVRLAGAAWAVAAAIVLLHVTLGAPDDVTWWRWSDRNHALAERLGTAAQVAARGARNDLEAALLADADRRARGVDVAAGQPWPPTTLMARAWAACALAAVLWTVPAPRFEPGPVVRVTGMDAVEPVAPLDPARTEATVRRVAELIDAQAREEETYLRAVGRALAELADEIEAGAIDDAATRAELSRLLGQLSQAVGDDGPLADALEAFAAEVREGGGGDGAPEADVAATADEGDGAAPDLPPGTVADANPGAEGSTADGAGDPGQALDDVLDELERRREAAERAAEERAAAGATNANEGAMLTYVQADEAALAELAERRRALAEQAEAAGAATPIGAAETSDDSAGDFAGEGSQALEMGLREPPPSSDADAGPDVRLEGDVREDGTRYRTTGETDVVVTDVQPAPSGPTAPWWRTRQTADPTRPLAPDRWTAVRRYFDLRPAEASSALP